MRVRKNSTVEKTEVEYKVTSFEEVIESYKEERKKIYKYLQETMNIKLADNNKSLFQLIENVTTDFISNWC